MPTNLLLLPFLGGYWFLHGLHYTRYRSQRLDGYRLLTESALAGLGLTVLARLLVMLLRTVPGLKDFWLWMAPPIEYLGTAFAALLLGLALPYGVNVILHRTGLLTRDEAHRRAIARHGNELIRLLHEASGDRLVALTLDNLKVYTGLVAQAPNLEPHDAYVTIIPFLSGYRVKETLELKLVVDYLQSIERSGRDLSEFRVTIPLAAIKMAGFFDPALYEDFQIETRTQ